MTNFELLERDASRVHVRHFNAWLWFILPLWCLAMLITYPPHTLDLAVSSQFFSAGTWPLHNNWLFAEVFHKGGKVFAAFPALITLIILWRGINNDENRHAAYRQRFIYALIAMIGTLSTIWLLKSGSQTPCPWDSIEFGGRFPMVAPFSGFNLFHSATRCWPGGHAGTGFFLFSCYFALRDLRPGFARNMGFLALGLGLVLGSARMMQGAHFLSHNFATLLIDWLLCAGLYVMMFGRRAILTPSSWRLPPLSLPLVPLYIALIWTSATNIAFWSTLVPAAGLWRTSDTLFLVSFFIILTALFTLLLSLLALLPSRVFKTLVFVLSIIAAVGSAFSTIYGTVMSPDMLRNALATDPAEITGLLSTGLVWRVLLAMTPITALLFAPIASKPHRPIRLQTLSGGLIALACASALTYANFQGISSSMRNKPQARYLIAPMNILYSSVRTTLSDGNPDAIYPREIIDPSPRQSITPQPNDKNLLVVVIGETARAQNWGLNGYTRDTTPELRQRSVINFSDVTSCGTSTDVSLPCMFSRIGRANYDRQKILREEGLIDILKRAGVQVIWRDNQSGCKGVCRAAQDLPVNPQAKECKNGVCLDGALISDINEKLFFKKGAPTVLFLHMIGSHGPAYWQRSPQAQKKFTPECTDADLSHCSAESIVNAYDNSILYTDRVLSQTIDWLKSMKGVNTGLIYVSDHGESLGEKNLYLHGAPYFIAPEVQKHVPMVMWFSEGFQKHFGFSRNAIERHVSQPVSHDNLYHTVLGLLGVSSRTYDPQLDLSR